MADIDGEMLVTYKGMIDEGYDPAMGEGLKLEHQRSVAHNAAVTPEMVDARRAAAPPCRRADESNRTTQNASLEAGVWNHQIALTASLPWA